MYARGMSVRDIRAHLEEIVKRVPSVEVQHAMHVGRPFGRDAKRVRSRAHSGCRVVRRCRVFVESAAGAA
jgi:hypothetical protein